MRKLIVLAVVVLLLGFLADIATKALAESQIETTADKEAPEASSDAAIPVFPFLPPLLVAGKVDEVSLRMTHVPAGPVFFDRLDFDLHGVQISRRALLNERRVELVAIERGTVTAVVPLPAAAQALPISDLTARVSGRTIVVRGAGVSVSIPMPAPDLVPCAATATLQAGRVRLTCTLTEIPRALVEALNQAS
ncbi:MAG: hypothetical protein QOG87_3060 [Actinomycetota bacterium]